MRKLILGFLFVGAVIFISSCKSEKKEGPQPTEFEQSLIAADTAAVKQKVDDFFKLVEKKEYADAINMIYRVDSLGMPQELNNEEISEVMGMLKSVPMVDYRIEYIKFNERTYNEVLCYVIMQKATDDMPEMSTKMFFKPVLNAGNWYLCLTNTAYGDKGVVDPDKRDSVEQKYQEIEAAKSASKK